MFLVASVLMVMDSSEQIELIVVKVGEVAEHLELAGEP